MKTFLSLLIGLFWMVNSTITQAQDPNFHIYLAFGQSNMEGAGAIESQDRVGVDVRFQVMGALDCTGNHTHQLGKWTTATPPLVRCQTGLGVSDYFGRTMVQDLPVGIKIGIVPVAVGGSDIALFDKVNYASYVDSAPQWMKDIINSYGGNPYGRLVEVAKLAQKEGVIKGIIFHQGETNTNNPEWKNKVADVVKNLKIDLQLGDVPFLAGELLASTGACCGSHNVEVNKLPSLIPNAHVISSADLVGTDAAHFSPASYREFGKRYAKKMIEALGLGTCTPTAITPYVQINGGSWQQASSTTVASGSTVILGPQPASGGSWSWSGMASGTTREVILTPISSGTATATYTNTSDCKSTQVFTITVSGGSTIVTIKNRATGLLMDGIGRTSAGSTCGQWASSGSWNQMWMLETSGAYVYIKNRNTGLYIDGRGVSTNGSYAGQWTSSTSNNLQWQQETIGSYVKFKNRATGLYLDGLGNTTNGADLGQWATSTSNNQQWTVTAVSGARLSATEEVSVEKNDGNASLSPNPFTTGIKVSIRDPKLVKSIRMFDLAGKQVEVIEHENVKTEQMMGSLLNTGLYVIQINGLNSRQSFKVIKK